MSSTKEIVEKILSERKAEAKAAADERVRRVAAERAEAQRLASDIDKRVESCQEVIEKIEIIPTLRDLNRLFLKNKGKIVTYKGIGNCGHLEEGKWWGEQYSDWVLDHSHAQAWKSLFFESWSRDEVVACGVGVIVSEMAGQDVACLVFAGSPRFHRERAEGRWGMFNGLQNCCPLDCKPGESLKGSMIYTRCMSVFDRNGGIPKSLTEEIRSLLEKKFGDIYPLR